MDAQLRDALPVHDPAQGPHALDYLAAVSPDVRVIRVLLRAVALLGVPAARSERQAWRAVAGHRQTALHHHRHAGIAAVDSLGGHVHQQGTASLWKALDAPATPCLPDRHPPRPALLGAGGKGPAAAPACALGPTASFA